MSAFLSAGDAAARLILYVLPSRISSRIRENTSPLDVYVLSTREVRRRGGACGGGGGGDGGDEKQRHLQPRMTLFEGVFATLLFDMALFGTSNLLINFVIRTFTSIQNRWDALRRRGRRRGVRAGVLPPAGHTG